MTAANTRPAYQDAAVQPARGCEFIGTLIGLFRLAMGMLTLLYFVRYGSCTKYRRGIRPA